MAHRDNRLRPRPASTAAFIDWVLLNVKKLCGTILNSSNIFSLASRVPDPFSLISHVYFPSSFTEILSSRFKGNPGDATITRSEEHTSELQSRFDLVCRLLLEKKKANVDIY